ncbi:MAG: winged helix-turn-helix transcriptional regulator [Microthrixaceae bacterium]
MAELTGDNPQGDDPSREDGSHACSIARSLDVMGDRWSILILRDTFRGIRRFEEIRRDLEIPRAVLSDRLATLVGTGVLERRQYMEHPPRHEYRLTDMGRELSPVLVGLMQWGDRWLGNGRAPTVLVHDQCGTEVDLGFHCESCNRDFGPTEIEGRPGPGATAVAPTPSEPIGSTS